MGCLQRTASETGETTLHSSGGCNVTSNMCVRDVTYHFYNVQRHNCTGEISKAAFTTGPCRRILIHFDCSYLALIILSLFHLLPQTGKQEAGPSQITPVGTSGGLRPLDQVTCFKVRPATSCLVCWLQVTMQQCIHLHDSNECFVIAATKLTVDLHMERVRPQ